MGLVVGIDPGLGMSGAVVLDEDSNLKAWQVWTSKPVGHILPRVLGMGYDITSWLVDTCGKGPLQIVMEHPIFSKNALGFAKQIRLFHTIEEFLVEQGLEDGMWSGGRIIEVLPHGPRKSLGLKASAPKALITDIFRTDYGAVVGDLPRVQMEACGDSWAIATCVSKPDLWHQVLEFE